MLDPFINKDKDTPSVDLRKGCFSLDHHTGAFMVLLVTG